MPPDAFGPFRVLHQIGAGALGPVFRAFDPERERLVAVKLFRLDVPPERVHQLAGEFDALIAADLSHPVIVAPHSAGITGVSAYLAFEFVAADSLDLILRAQGSVPVAGALRLIGALAEALDAAAARGVYHGALHPRDVLVSADETRLTGLGVTRALDVIGIAAPLRRPYTAPERVEGGVWDHRADIFSLAAMAHELIWGKRLTGAGEEAAHGITAIEGGDAARLRRVFARALAVRRSDRFDDAESFVEALAAAFVPVEVPLPLEDNPPLDDAPLRVAPIADEDAELQLNRPRLEEVVGADAVDSLRRLEEETPFELGPTQTVASRLAEIDAADVEPRAPMVPFLAPFADGSDDVPVSKVIEPVEMPRTSPAFLPLAAALLLGVAIGFAGGYPLGRTQPSSASSTASDAPVAPDPSPVAPDRPPASAAPVSAPGAVNGDVHLASPPPPPPPEVVAEASAPKAAAPAAAGRLVVRSTPSGARVLVDGREVGRTPITARNLSRGAHQVQVTRDAYTPVARRVTVTAATPSPTLAVTLQKARASVTTETPAATSRAAAASGSVNFESRPTGATVFVDGIVVGSTPLVLPALAPGEHNVRLEQLGYQRWNSTVHVVAGERVRVAASLEK